MLISGLPGVPGYNAFHYFRRVWGESVIGLCPLHALKQKHPGTEFVEASDEAAMENLFRTHRFGSVIDASGWCALKSCEFDPKKARLLNLTAGVTIARLCSRYGARLIRLSTDLVFDGNPRCEKGVWMTGDYQEDSPVSPVTVYGKTMAEAEGAILTENPEAVVLRIALPMGPSFNGHAGAIDWIDSRFRHGRPATLYYDEVRSNLYVQDLHKVMAFFLRTDWAGIFHVGGGMPLSLFEIAQTINRVGGYAPELLHGCLRHEAGPMPPRAGNVTMDCAKLRSVFPEGMPGHWPRAADHIPLSPTWHGERQPSPLDSGIVQHLYGYASGQEGAHPMEFIPALISALHKIPRTEMPHALDKNGHIH